MGFYGNIRNATNNSFKFDRVYSNRVLMEQNADGDGVFGGRYVLVEYDQKLNENPVESSKNIYKITIDNHYEYFTKIETPLDPLPEAYLNEDLTVESKVYYIYFSGKIEDPTNYFLEKKGIVFCEKEFEKVGGDYTLYYTIGQNPTVEHIDHVQICGNAETITNYQERWYLYDPDGQKQFIPSNADSDAYTINAAIDRTFFGVGRGYDSTVWRKVYDNQGHAKYVNIADLNSVVPTFAITAEAPYDIPTKPHWDKDSTNVYYNLHLQSPWSFRIADISDPNSESYKFLNEDESNAVIEKPNITYDSSGHFIIPKGDNETSDPYPGAIYFNKAGFDKNESVHSRFDGDIDSNIIRLDNYSSGLLYPSKDPEESLKQPYPDTKELSIILPAIGDTIASMWDIIYGTERKLNISWDDANSKSDFDEERLRLVHDKNYTPEDSQTLAGAINSAHDLIGMIITDPTSSIDGQRMPDDANEAHQWQIYYNPPQKTGESYKGNSNFEQDAYYYAGSTLGFEELEYPFIDEEGNPVGRTADDFRSYFGEENQGYVKVRGLKDIHLYVSDSENDPLFSNYENGNIYKRVNKNIDFASPGEVYYNIPTDLTYIAAVMRPSDTKDWYYHPEGNTDDFRKLPNEEKMEAMDDQRDYYWIDTKIATESENDNAYIIHVSNAPLFRIWTLSDPDSPNEDINRIYSYRAWPDFPEYYKQGNYTCFDDVITRENIVKQNEPISIRGEDTIYGIKGNVYYDLENVFYKTGTTTYYDAEKDEWITGDTYKSHKAVDIIFADHQINQDRPFYLYAGNSNGYEKKSWSYLYSAEDLSTPTQYKYNIKTTRLRREGECYYFKLDTSTQQGQAKFEQLNSWVADPNRPSDLLNIKQEGYLDFILEFNKNKQEDSLNPNYHYFIANDSFIKKGYGIAEKKSAYEDPYILTSDLAPRDGKTYYVKNGNNYEVYSTTPWENGINIYEAQNLNIFYTEKTLYFLDEVDGLYKKAERINDYIFEEGDELYRKNNEYYIVDCGDFTGFNIYQKLNVEIIQEDSDLDRFFKPEYELTQDTQVLNKKYYQRSGTENNWTYSEFNVPEGGNPSTLGLYEQTKYPLIIGYGYKERIWKELQGFARDINTLHGWLLRLNEILQPNDTRTRDPNTIQGCINQMKDLLDKFGPLIPGLVLTVDAHGRIAGEELADILLKSEGEPVIGTLTSPSGDVDIITSETLRTGIEKLIEHINAGASNITLNEYNNYYNDSPYFVTEDTERDPNKTYYIKQGNSFVVYTVDPWPDENRPVIYEKYEIINGNIPDVDNNDNINEAIAKLQWQLNHIANRKLTDLDASQNALPSNYTPFDGDNVSGAILSTDNLGLGLNKLQEQIKNLNIRLNSTNTDIVNNYCGIIRMPSVVDSNDNITTAPTTEANHGNYSNSNIKSGWLWVDTRTHYVYIKTNDAIKAESFVDEADRNYWELLNAWQ